MHLEKEKYTNQVSKELYLNLQDDEIEFSNEIFQSIYYEMIHQLNQEDKIEMEAFINHPNTNISSIVTSILMDDEKYTLSDWERKNIFVTESEEVLSKLVTDAILNLRRILIDKKIQQLINPKEGVSVENTDLEMIQNYTELKKRLFSKLMRVV
jgi:DNA primase